MKLKILIPALLIIVSAEFIISCHSQQKTISRNAETIVASDPLPSWNIDAAKTAIIDFVTKTTKKGGADFIPVADRIACFDNDFMRPWTDRQTCRHSAIYRPETNFFRRQFRWRL